MRNREVLGTGRSLSFGRVTVDQKVIYPRMDRPRTASRRPEQGRKLK